MSRKRTQREKVLEQEDTEEIPRKRNKKAHKSSDKENASQAVNVVDEEMVASTSEQSQSQRAVMMRNMQGSVSAELKSGKIKKILLKNFMCHSNFEVNLNLGVNIFMGLNGSGKSAILTAIAIGLGSKAASTARSTNLKDLVRRGEATASIEITLTNDGMDAYEEESFGKEIVVVRNINGNTGTSAYKIKSHNGRVISTSRQDLTKLTMCMNIQVENPVLILNQDAARSFLKECDPKKLYAFFMKATQIETIIEKLNSCLQTAVASKNRLETLGKTIQHGELELEALREKHTRLQSVARLREKIEQCKNEIDWVRVTNAEKELQQAQTNLTKSREELKKVEDLIKNKSKYEKDIKEKIRELGTNIEALRLEAEEKTKLYEASRVTYETERDKFSGFDNKIKEMSKSLDRLKENVAQLEKDIAEHENNPENVDNIRRENEAKIVHLEEQKKDTLAMLQNSLRDHKMFYETLTESKENLEGAKQRYTRETDQLRRMDQQMDQFKKAGKDSLMVYGNSMSNLMRDIEKLHRSKKFSALPRGPIGRYIEVSDKKYRSAVENILDRILLGFIVNSDEDRVLLKRTIQKYHDLQNIAIISCRFQDTVYDIRDGIAKVDKSMGEVLYNVITVQDPVVMNCLIDNKQIERIVLADHMEKATQLTLEENNVPQNLGRVVLLHPFSEYYPAPDYRTYSLKENPVRYIQTNNKDIIKSIEEQKKRCNERRAAISNEMKEIEVRIKEEEKRAKEKKRISNEIQLKLDKFAREIHDLKSIEYPEETDIEFKRTLLEDEKQKKLACEEKVIKCKKKVDVLKEISDGYKKKMEELQADHRATRNKILEMQNGIETAQGELQDMKKDIQSKNNQIQKFKDEEIQNLTLVQNLQASTSQLQGKARGNRVECNRQEDAINLEIRATEKRIQRIESSHENIDDVSLLLENKTKNVEDMRNIFNALDNILKKLEKIRESRYQYVRRLRHHMILRMRHKFSELMGIRQYQADIEISTADRELVLKIIPRDGGVEGAVSNTKSLSGGERSYSTVAFLIALWSCVDHPFYFLDEYDVFSDEYNRHIMTLLLLNEANKKQDKQFGFLTPQEFSNIEASNRITIHRLQDPDHLQ